ncbi:ABC transporter-like protein [Actinobacillus pleuropneumoniae]|nr:ABC transporter-like protein [Actinobacillus pleuropneumoniae]
MTRLETYDLSLKYQDKFVIQHLGISFEKGSVYSIIGPNGCGKSTLLKALARQLKPAGGQVLLDSKPLSDLNGKDVARQLSYMAQSQEPIEITVKELGRIWKNAPSALLESCQRQGPRNHGLGIGGNRSYAL